MKLFFRTPSLLASALVLAILLFGQTAAAQHRVKKSSVGAGFGSQYASVPLSFERNMGQAPEGVEFLARGANYTAFLRANEMVLALSRRNLPENNGAGTGLRDAVVRGTVQGTIGRSDSPVSLLHIHFADAADGNGLQGLDQLPGKVNYFLGNNPARWRSGVSTFARIENKSLYPGIGVQYYSNRGELEYDFRGFCRSRRRSHPIAVAGSQQASPDRRRRCGGRD